MNTLETQCVRIARAGIKLAAEGDIAGGQALIKTADALAQGYNPQDVLDALFAKDAHEKVAQVLGAIANQPSDVALYKHAAVQEAKQQIFQEAAAKQAAAKQASAKQTAFDKLADIVKKK